MIVRVFATSESSTINWAASPWAKPPARYWYNWYHSGLWGWWTIILFNSGVVLTPPPPPTPSLLDFSLSPSSPRRLVHRPVRLVSQETPIGGRISDLDRGRMSSVVTRLSGPGQVRVIKSSILWIYLAQLPIESTRVDAEDDSIFEEPEQVFVDYQIFFGKIVCLRFLLFQGGSVC